MLPGVISSRQGLDPNLHRALRVIAVVETRLFLEVLHSPPFGPPSVRATHIAGEVLEPEEAAEKAYTKLARRQAVVCRVMDL